MNTLIDKPQNASYSGGYVTVVMQSGLEYRFPIKGNERLEKGTDKELKNIVTSPFGLHWPDLNEDLSIRGISRGDFGQVNTKV